MKFTIIGIDDNRNQEFSKTILNAISNQKVFSGGMRHHEIIRHLLPINHIWIAVEVPLDKTFAKYVQYQEIVVFASGDPLFLGIGNTIHRNFPEAEMEVYPYFNSLQTLAHRLLLPYEDMYIVTLTGRPWDKFDEALIRGYEKIGILTDKQKHTPLTIADRMITYGYTNYTMTVGELLGNKECERIRTFNLDEIQHNDFQHPNNIILTQTHQRERFFGIPDHQFRLLNNRAKMITKMPIRLLSLSELGLPYKSVLWDVGFCTGSVSIEAKLQFPHLKIVSFEVRPEGDALMLENSIRFGTPGIEYHIGDFITSNKEHIPAPDAIFIGGHGGKLKEIVKICSQYLKSEGCIVFNSVSEESLSNFRDAIDENHLRLVTETSIMVDSNNPITVMKAIKL